MTKREVFLNEIRVGNIVALKKNACPEVRAFEVLSYDERPEMWILQDIEDDFVSYQPDNAISRKKTEGLQCLNQITKKNSARVIEELKELQQLVDGPVKLSIKENWVNIRNIHNDVLCRTFQCYTDGLGNFEVDDFTIQDRFFIKSTNDDWVALCLIDVDATKAENVIEIEETESEEV